MPPPHLPPPLIFRTTSGDVTSKGKTYERLRKFMTSSWICREHRSLLCSLLLSPLWNIKTSRAANVQKRIDFSIKCQRGPSHDQDLYRNSCGGVRLDIIRSYYLDKDLMPILIPDIIKKLYITRHEVKRELEPYTYMYRRTLRLQDESKCAALYSSNIYRGKFLIREPCAHKTTNKISFRTKYVRHNTL